MHRQDEGVSISTMKISKYGQSCLLIEEDNQVILIDPGSYSEEYKEILLSNVTNLDYILITHDHLDHMSPSLIREVIEKFPDATVISNTIVKEMLMKENIDITTEKVPGVEFETIDHERLWFGNPTKNTVFTVFGKLTHPGDSLHFTSSADIVALPLTAPWGSTVEAVEKAMELHPKTIIPIHDSLWKDEVRKSFYTRLKDYFNQQQIEFIEIENGETIEV